MNLNNVIGVKSEVSLFEDLDVRISDLSFDLEDGSPKIEVEEQINVDFSYETDQEAQTEKPFRIKPNPLFNEFNKRVTKHLKQAKFSLLEVI